MLGDIQFGAYRGERQAVYEVVRSAFGQADEADIVERLRACGQALLEWVAADDSGIIGHALVSPIEIDPPASGRYGGVAPVSVLPECQGRGIGSGLMEVVIEACRQADIDALFLLGDPAFYARFGFRRSHLGNEYGATDAFMHLELRAGALEGLVGVAKYASAFQ